MVLVRSILFNKGAGWTESESIESIFPQDFHVNLGLDGEKLPELS